MNYAEELWRSGTGAIEAIKSDPFERKILNFIKNDLAGIINRFEDDRITFEYNDKLVCPEFMNALTDTLRDVGFKEERYDKKLLRENITHIFEKMIEDETFIEGRKELQNSFWFPLCDREFKLLLHIKHSYDQDNT